MSFDEEVRIRTIMALFSDDLLFEQIVLKGGNAMTLIHRIQNGEKRGQATPSPFAKN